MLRSRVTTTNIRRTSVAAGLLLVANAALGAGPEVTPDRFPGYHPARTVIKCPYLPPGLEGASVPTCAGKPATCVGTDDHDLIIGTEGDDVIVGGAGNDVIHADAGNDIVCGGPGNDSLMGARGSDALYGEEGDDWLFGAPEADTLDGGPGDFDVLWGGPGFDHLDGGPGSNDVCLLQKELGEYDAEDCDTIYPPPGYLHEDDPDPGVLREAEPLKLR